jgi:hypothetical protein
MSLKTQIENLTIRVGTEAKSLRTLLNGNAADLSSLTTTAKGNLVAAINELKASIGSIVGNTDLSIGTADGASLEIVSSTGDNVTISAATVLLAGLLSATDKEKLDNIASGATANSPDATLLSRANHTGTQPHSTISDFDAAVNALIESVIDSAPAALDTLNELAAALGDDPNFAATINASLGNRLRVDAAQSLTTLQKQQARDNIDVYSESEIGDITTDFVAIFESNLI